MAMKEHLIEAEVFPTEVARLANISAAKDGPAKHRLLL